MGPAHLVNTSLEHPDGGGTLRALAEPPPLSSSQTVTFGKYELLDRIAAGGMAEIFRARYEPAPGVTKQVVIKRILPHYAANKAFVGMFTNEAKIVMGLSHGNIAQVFDFGSIDGDWFLAMELVDGHALSKVVKRMRTMGIPVMPPEFAAFMTAEMLKGLHYAHSRLDEAGRPMKIVHRDVSPQNVLISYEGQVKLVDFGIARARNAGPEDSSANAVKGKYAYFAPEQARAKDLDARTDIFAAGIVLYELLTGQLPFQGRLMDVLAHIVRGQFKKPRELNPRIPPELEKIVLKAMALEKADRYQTAEAFQQDLNRFLSAKHPEFTAGMLTHFLQFLFEEELVKDGRPVQLPRDFIERVQKWKEPLPLPPEPGKSDESESPTEMVSVGPSAANFAPVPRFDDVPARRTRFPWGRALVLLLVATLVGFGAVTVVQRLREGTLEITSEPAGAAIVLDGHPLEQKTPATVNRLQTNAPHQVQLALEGYQPWKNDVPLKPGQHLVVPVKLEPVPPPAPPQPEPVAVVEPPKPVEPPPVPNAVAWPQATFELDAVRHRIDLSTTGATVVPLEPGRTYRVSLLGNAKAPGWGFYVVSDGGAQPGVFGADPLIIRSASRIFAFHVPEHLLGAGKDESRPRALSVRDEKTKKTRSLPVSPRLDVPDTSRVTVTGLDPDATYELTPRPTEARALLRPHGAGVSMVLVATPRGLLLASLNEPTRIEGADHLWIALLDDLTDEETGRLRFELREVKPPHKKRHR